MGSLFDVVKLAELLESLRKFINQGQTRADNYAEAIRREEAFRGEDKAALIMK